MISLKIKKIIARIFLVLVITPALFMMPIFSGQTGQTEVYAQGNEADGVITAPSPDIKWSCLWNPAICIIVYSAWAVFIKVPSFVALVASAISNNLFSYGLSSATYRDVVGSPFINVGWVVCRDIANTFFIFALLYIAIMTILGQLSGGTKKLLITIIVVALFMNFSMYVTRFVVDVGNMTAIEFYNAFGDGTNNPTNEWYVIDFPEIIERNITKGFLSPITTMSNRVLDLASKEDIVNHWSYIVFVWFALGCVIIVFAFVMLAASFLMVGRIAMIWILMILSPLAFFAKAVPKFERYFGEWTGKLIQQTFFPAVFLFFVYLASVLMNAITVAATPGGAEPFVAAGKAGTLTALLMTTLIRAAIVAGFLIYGLKTASSMAGQAGAMASKYLTIGTGAALGVGAAGMRGIAGRSSQYLKDKWEKEGTLDQKKTTVFGRMQLATLDKAQNSSFDIRNTGGFQSAAGTAGLRFEQGKAKTYAQKEQEGEKERQDTFNSLKTDQQKIDYLKSIYSPNILGKGNLHPVDFGVGARKLMASMPFNKQQELIASAKDGADKHFMRQISADLGEQNYSKENILSQYKALEGHPEKQAEYIKKLRKGERDENGNMVRARNDDEMRSVMKDLTETNRAEIETNLRTPEVVAIQEKLKDQNLPTEERERLDKELAGTDYGAVAKLNKEVFEKLKPRQQDLAKAERRNFEKEEGFRMAKNDLKEKIKAYSALNAVEQEKTRGEIAELVKKMGDNRIATLDEEDLANEHVAKHLTKTQLEKINRSNTLNLTDEHWKKIKQAVKEGDDEKAKEYLDLSPRRTVNRQSSDNDLGDLRS
jgi:hypothetical protein